MGTNVPIRHKEGYFPTTPQDTLMDFRNDACTAMEDSFGIVIDAHHHEVATAGQCEINMMYDTLVSQADSAQSFKYVVKNVAHQKGMVATFMPKPLVGDNGTGMHCHQSIWKDGKNTFYDENDERVLAAFITKMYDDKMNIIPERLKSYEELFEKYGSKDVISFT